MRRIQEAFLTDCYAGGRNEAFCVGITPIREWRDFDLAGAYSTGLVDLPLIDFENPQPSLNVADYLGHVAGYALVEFEHPPKTRFPVFAVSRGGKGLIFPLKGTAYTMCYGAAFSVPMRIRRWASRRRSSRMLRWPTGSRKTATRPSTRSRVAPSHRSWSWGLPPRPTL